MTRSSAAAIWSGTIPDPAAVSSGQGQHCRPSIRGNHDKAIAGIDSLEWFNPVAQASARWTQKQLDCRAPDVSEKL